MRVLQVNTTLNTGSTGRIVEGLCRAVSEAGHASYAAAAVINPASMCQAIRVGSNWDRAWHGVLTRVFDRHGFGSAGATRALVRQLGAIAPDVVHLHNAHGYYLNLQIFLEAIDTLGCAVVWTLHDCWPFTGHCSYFDRVQCSAWRTECRACPNLRGYPASWFVDRSNSNFHQKREIICGLRGLHIVTPSRWLARHVAQSFLRDFPIHTIHNGVDWALFRPMPDEPVRAKYGLGSRHFLLGVASVWDERKGLADFVTLSGHLAPGEALVLVGLTSAQAKGLPGNIVALPRTESISDLAALYSAALALVNPTYADNFPTTNLEALACGTPVITYDTGGSPEAVDESTGAVVPQGNVESLAVSARRVMARGKVAYAGACRERAVKSFDSRACYRDYLGLYEACVEEAAKSQREK